MSLKTQAIQLVKNPENDQISKARVLLVIITFIFIFASVLTYILQSKKNKYLAEQQAQIQQKRSQASDIPMAATGIGEDTKQYLDRQAKIKNMVVIRDAPNNGLSDPLAAQNVPPIVGTDGKPVTQVSSKTQQVINQPQQGQDPIAQEYQNQKLDKIKHDYAAYRADTLLVQQSINNNESQTNQVKPSNGDDKQNIPQPANVGVNNSQPSNGYSQASSSKSSSPQQNSLTDDSNNSGQNQQNEKNNFMTSKAKDLFSDDYDNAVVKDPISRYEIKAGTPIPAFMITPINSDLPGMVTAQVARNIFDSKTGNYLLIPGGSKLVGVYDSNISYGQSRVMVAWNRVIFPSGASYKLNGMPGTDAMGISGVTGDVNNHYGRIYGSAMVMGVITAGMQYSQNNSNPNVQSGSTYQNPTVSQSLSAGLGQQLGQAGLQVTQKNLNVQPTIEIPASQQINIMLAADVVLRPINKKTYAGNGIGNVRGN